MNRDTQTFITWEQAVESVRTDPERISLVRDCYYDDPLAAAATRFCDSEEWQAIETLLPFKAATVLDLGAGRGISSFAFAKSGWNVTALEPDSSEIVGANAIRGLARDANVEIHVAEEWGESLPFDDQAFDLVYGRAVFHHARDLGEFCREAARVLKPGGVFLMTREHVLSSDNDLQRFLEAHALHHLYGGEAAYMLDAYLDAISNAGMMIEKVIGPNSSVINYFPQSISEHHHDLVRRLGRGWGRPGRFAAAILLQRPWFRRYVERKLDEADQRPGRLYSFLAVKH